MLAGIAVAEMGALASSASIELFNCVSIPTGCPESDTRSI